MADEFVMESTVRGFHVYRAAWTPVLGEELIAERQPGNSEDAFAVRLQRGGEDLLAVYSPRLFNRRSNTLCKTAVTHSARRLGDTLCAEI